MIIANFLLKLTALVPLTLLALSFRYGAGMAFASLFYMSIFAFLADEALYANGEVGRRQGRIDAFLAEAVPLVLGLGHLVLLPLAVVTIAQGGQSQPDTALTFVAFMLFFGTVSTANAHELIHRRDRLRHHIGKWVFISILFGHHTSAHMLIHHRYAATRLDPNSARMNEGIYRFFLRAWSGSFRAGLEAETARQKAKGRPALHPANPYVLYIAGALIWLTGINLLAGGRGIAVYLGFTTLAQMQLLLSDYVQHYGLERQRLADDKYEPVSIHHSWNAPHAFTAALMLNAPKHSDHHAHPSVRYMHLRTRASEGAPVLPRSLPVMSCIALIPGLWRRVMNPRVDDWRRRHDAGRIGFQPTESPANVVSSPKAVFSG